MCASCCPSRSARPSPPARHPEGRSRRPAPVAPDRAPRASSRAKPMRTLIVSDLHLGSASRSDVLRSAELREPLLDAIGDVDRLILLGDVLELRHGPPGEALEVEQLLAAEQASPVLHRLAQWASPARLTAAYPGMWVRPDVYAMHGHYLDCHLTVPTLERLSVGAMGRLLGKPPQSLASVDDYESLGAPVFAWRDAIARDARTGDALNGLATVAAWRALGGGSEKLARQSLGADGATADD